MLMFSSIYKLQLFSNIYKSFININKYFQILKNAE